MNGLTVLFLAALFVSSSLRIWLARRQLQHVGAHRDSVPAAFASEIGLAAHRKAADYTAARTRLGVCELLLDLVLALAWTLGGGLTALDGAWRHAGLGPLATGVLVIASFALIGGVLGLPFSVWSTFVTEARFGFNRTRPGTFVLDIIKMLLLAALLGGPLLFAALWLIQFSGNWWWLYVWLLWMTFSLVLTWAFPVFIAPLFNRFTPLADASLKQRIESLLERCGFTSHGVFVMDGSARSAHGNAYFTGFGRHKRIVFFDTLMEKLSADEIEAVLAHELGHFRLHHVLQRLLVTALLSLAGLALLGWLASNAWFYSGLGVAQASSYMALLLFMLLLPPCLFLLEPAMSAWSRHHEFQADAYASHQTDAGTLSHALVKLYRDNASTLTPDPVHSLFHDSHPPAAARIARLNAEAHAG
ncbi:MAG TPA: M48 family metallopeptidase [Gammaproteobacteria bacterium]|nr:M48 family metallopeptidase [Gammaproteobacteria bacterium]